ncbi:hypothetical protein YC2023_110316 [Brassica napus]
MDEEVEVWDRGPRECSSCNPPGPERRKRLHTLKTKKLQSQAMVETEIIKLRALLVEMQGKIDNELGSFSFEKQMQRFWFCNV